MCMLCLLKLEVVVQENCSSVAMGFNDFDGVRSMVSIVSGLTYRYVRRGDERGFGCGDARATGGRDFQSKNFEWFNGFCGMADRRVSACSASSSSARAK